MKSFMVVQGTKDEVQKRVDAEASEHNFEPILLSTCANGTGEPTITVILKRPA